MTADVWLPIPPEEIEGLPDGLNCLFWDGGEDGEQEFPGDPADCVMYVVPYMKRYSVKVRPLERMLEAYEEVDVEARLHDRERICEVTTLVLKRVGAPVAETCFVDYSPPVLRAARDAGIRWIYQVLQPDSTRPPRAAVPGIIGIERLSQLL